MNSIAPQIRTENFSWSLRRDFIFKSCRLAYLFNYHLSQGGQSHYATDTCQSLYRLKHVRDADDWLRNIFLHAIQKTFNGGQLHTTHQAAVNCLRHHAFKIFHHGWHECIHQAWCHDPKLTNISEIYYGPENAVKTLFAEWLATMEQWLNAFTINSLFEKLWQIDSLKWRQLANPTSLYVNGIKVWSNPILAWRDHNYGAIMIYAYNHSMAINLIPICLASMILNQQTYLLLGEQEIMLYQPGHDDIRVYHPNQAEIYRGKITIHRSSAKMQEFEHAVKQGMQINGQRSATCNNCRFREMCQKNDFFTNGIQ